MCSAVEMASAAPEASFIYPIQSSSHGSAGKAEDLGNGEYRAHFTATVAGSYAVSASVHGTSIAGSPFVANVSAVEVDAACSYAAGDGVLSARSGLLVGLLPSNLLLTMRTSRNAN